MSAYEIEHGGDVVTVRTDDVKEGWEQWFLLTSDVHWDNPHCDRNLYKRHLDQAMERDADICAVGHVYESWLLELPRQRLTTNGELFFDSQWHIQLPTYKQEFDLAGGWHVERGAPPKPLGGWWLRWHWDATARDKVGMEVIRAT